MVIRAIVSLSIMYGESMNLDERRELSLKLCQLVSTSMNEEKRLAIIGIRNLKVEGEQQVFEILLKLLGDEDSNIRLEAGKALTVLKFK